MKKEWTRQAHNSCWINGSHLGGPHQGGGLNTEAVLQPSCPQSCQSPAHEARLSLLCSPSSHSACLLSPAGIPSLWYPSMSQDSN